MPLRTGRLALLAAVLAMSACTPAPPPAGKPAADAAQPSAKPAPTPLPDTRVVMLGTGTPNADPTRSGPAVAVVAKGKVYLVDAGAGIVRRAAAAKLAGVKELEMPALNRVFMTHLHSDHTVGLPDLMFSPWVLERSDPLVVHGPPGVANMVEHLMQAYAEDIELRLHGGEPSNKTGHRAIAEEIVPGVVHRGDGMTITAFPVPHGDWKHSYGYAFETDERRIVISGDTVASDEVVAQCRGCDVLVHEVYSAEAFKKRPAEWQRYHARYHTSTRELADVARRAQPKLLVLYHQLYWGSTDEDLVREIREAGYDGAVVSAQDLGVY